MNWQRGGLFLATASVLVALAGCATTGEDTGSINTISAPRQLPPVDDSSVASTSLPPIAGSTVQDQSQPMAAQPSPGLATADPGLTSPPDPTASPPVHTASADSSFVSLSDAGSISGATGRDLSGGLTVEKLLGGWTVTSGASQCRLNLTYTAKAGTSRYRASTPGCDITGLAPVASWQLAGSQVQLFNDAGSLIGTLLLSGNRFIGTLTGGQGISMVG